MTWIPVTELRITDRKAMALNVALNRISGEWDGEKLVGLLRELDNLERGLTGFGEDEIAKLLGKSFEGRTVEEIEVKRVPEIF